MFTLQVSGRELPFFFPLIEHREQTVDHIRIPSSEKAAPSQFLSQVRQGLIAKGLKLLENGSVWLLVPGSPLQCGGCVYLT